MNRLLAKLVPSEYRELEGGVRTLARTFGIAVAIRLVLMPIACHSDLISTYHRAYAVLKGFRPLYWLPHELIEAFFLVLYSPILALDEMLVWDGAGGAVIDFWLGPFASHPQILLSLFLFKLPYLLCDLAIALVLLRLFIDTPVKGLRAASMWLLNPITVFAFYLVGRPDPIGILLLSLALLSFRRSRPLRGAFGFGLAVWSMYWPVFLLPFLMLFSPQGRGRRLQFLAVALAPALLDNLAVLLEGGDPIEVPAISLVRTTFTTYLMGLHLDLGLKQTIFVFPTIYALLLMFVLVAKPRGDLLIRFSEYAFACLSLFYATSFFHPQHFTWCLLFLVILRARSNSTRLRYLHYLQILLLVPYTFFWKKTLFGFLLAPLDPDFFSSISAPMDWLAAYGSPLVLMNLARTAFSVVCVFTAGWVLFGGDQRVALNGSSATSEETMAPER